MNSTPLNEATVLAALRDIRDPEIPANIVELGLVYSVTIIEDWVGVKMTLTTPGCGLAEEIVESVRNRIRSIPGVIDGDVRLVWQPAWRPEMINPDTRTRLGIASSSSDQTTTTA